jgi:hypothetical protein
MNVVVCGTDKKHLGKQITMLGVARHRHLKGLFVSLFVIFLLAFGRSKNWMTPKARSREASSQLLAFRAIQLLDLSKANPKK